MERQLTEYEKAVLQALADGESQVEYAVRTLRGTGTVQRTMFLIRLKLNAKNAPHAVAIALRRGLIH